MCPLSWRSRFFKRSLDIALSGFGLLATGWIILLAWVLARWDTRHSGFFRQTRVGLQGKEFQIVKIRTMRHLEGIDTTVTTDRDPRITKLGAFFRRAKIDELPQLINVFRGEMSLVGPRPEVPEYANLLQGEDRLILSVRPGITGPATLRFRNEAAELGRQPDPESYNREVIFPEKVRLNLEYVKNYSLARDLKYIWRTVLPE